jgi:lipid-A-disaccharide synthase-like uncharacterized protein
MWSATLFTTRHAVDILKLDRNPHHALPLPQFKCSIHGGKHVVPFPLPARPDNGVLGTMERKIGLTKLSNLK